MGTYTSSFTFVTAFSHIGLTRLYTRNLGTITKQLDYYSDGKFVDTKCFVDTYVQRTATASVKKLKVGLYLLKENLKLAWDDQFPRECDSGLVPNSVYTKVSYNLNAQTSDNTNSDNFVHMAGFVWMRGQRGHWPRPELRIIQIGQQVGGSSSSPSGQGVYSWEDSCVYRNDSYEVDVDSSKSSGRSF